MAVHDRPCHDAWAPLIGVLAALTMTVGNLVALRQTVAVRLLAWSTVAQAGWVVLPFASVDGSAEGVRAAWETVHALARALGRDVPLGTLREVRAALPQPPAQEAQV